MHTTLVADITDNGFSNIFGNSRGITVKPSTMVDTDHTIAFEERRRLMDLAVAGNFREPLEALRACKSSLDQWPNCSTADVLNMCTATQVVNYTDKWTAAIGVASGWDLPDAFASGISSRMAHYLESVLCDSPESACENHDWFITQWEARLPVILAKRLQDSVSDADRDDITLNSITNILGDREAAHPREPLIDTYEEWLAVATAMLPKGFTKTTLDATVIRKAAQQALLSQLDKSKKTF